MKTREVSIFSPVGGEVDQPSLVQLQTCMEDSRAIAGALMADHHKGYSMPIGGVIAYEGAVSPSAVGFDIGCGNMAVRTEAHITEAYSAEEASNYEAIRKIMREVQRRVAFGLGRTSDEPVDHPLFEDNLWSEIEQLAPDLKTKARAQLGTVGSGNHYVDILVDEDGFVWVANHFGSRGFGHTIASGFLNLGAGKAWDERVVERDEPTIIDTDGYTGQLYLECMRLAGEYAYAGREHVMGQVLEILGRPEVSLSVHNHHNFAWEDIDNVWVHRKGATPLLQIPAFIGGSMGDISVIVKGKTHKVYFGGGGDGIPLVREIGALGSAPHGAGRQMSRTKAAGKFKKVYVESLGKKVRMRDPSTAAIDWRAVQDELAARGIAVLGAGADEAPGAYKSLESVLAAHPNVEIMHRLKPIGVVMAGADTYDPYKD